MSITTKGSILPCKIQHLFLLMKKRIMDKNLFNRLIKSTEQMVMIEKKLVAKVESITKIPLENVSCADVQNPHTFSQNLNKN